MNLKPGRPRKDLQWDLLETEFIEGLVDENGIVSYPTVKQLAMRHGFTTAEETRLREKVTDDGWRLKRNQYKEKLRQIARAEKAIALSQKKEQFDVDCLKIAEVGIGQIKVHMMKYIQLREAVPVRDLERLARTFQKFQIAGKLALGDRIQDMASSIDVDTEKLDNVANIQLDELDKDELRQMSRLLEKAANVRDGQEEE